MKTKVKDYLNKFFKNYVLSSLSLSILYLYVC